MKLFTDILSKFDTIGIFSVLVFFLIKRPKTEGAFYWFMGFVFSMCSFNFLAEVQDICLTYFNITGNNLPLYHIACILYVITLSRFFDRLFYSKWNKIVDLVFLIPFLILSIFNFIYLKRTFTIYGLTSIWVVVKCLFHYTSEFTNPMKRDILQSKIFWIVSGLFLYFSVAFFIFITWDFLLESSYISNNFFFAHLWLLHNCILALSCCFFIKSIYCVD